VGMSEATSVCRRCDVRQCRFPASTESCSGSNIVVAAQVQIHSTVNLPVAADMPYPEEIELEM
jgi:hypothetical protein